MAAPWAWTRRLRRANLDLLSDATTGASDGCGERRIMLGLCDTHAAVELLWSEAGAEAVVRFGELNHCRGVDVVLNHRILGVGDLLGELRGSEMGWIGVFDRV